MAKKQKREVVFLQPVKVSGGWFVVFYQAHAERGAIGWQLPTSRFQQASTPFQSQPLAPFSEQLAPDSRGTV